MAENSRLPRSLSRKAIMKHYSVSPFSLNIEMILVLQVHIDN